MVDRIASEALPLSPTWHSLRGQSFFVEERVAHLFCERHDLERVGSFEESSDSSPGNQHLSSVKSGWQSWVAASCAPCSSASCPRQTRHISDALLKQFSHRYYGRASSRSRNMCSFLFSPVQLEEGRMSEFDDMVLILPDSTRVVSSVLKHS